MRCSRGYLHPKQRSLFVGFMLFSSLCLGQLLDVDYSSGTREESQLRVQFLRSGILGVSSLKHLDLTVEGAKIRYDNRKGNQLSLTLYGTQTLWRGNRIDALNTFDFLMNPIGGSANGALFYSVPLNSKDLHHNKMALAIGNKWIQGPPLPNAQNTSFFDRYGRLGWVYQSKITEDPLTNSSLYFWSFPALLVHQGSALSRQQFFNGELTPWSYGYAIELGMEYNSQFKFTLLGQQLLNTVSESSFGQFVARLIVSYRF